LDWMFSRGRNVDPLGPRRKRRFRAARTDGSDLRLAPLAALGRRSIG
jgi:hypothetical protein